MRTLFKQLTRAWRDESGVASIEFLFALPVLMITFMASFESGMVMTRSIMLEQSLDMVMRELRLGHIDEPDSQVMKEEICKLTVIFTDCEASLTMEFYQVSTATFDLPDLPADCVNREEELQPVTALQIGQQNDLMLVRACIVQDAMFPTTGIGLGLSRTDQGGGYEIIASSAFSNEPS
jgi:hypothetical protein